MLFELPEDGSVLRALDQYEEFIPELPVANQFVRVLCNAQTTAGCIVPCWIYVYARNLASARRIDDGHWRGPAS